MPPTRRSLIGLAVLVLTVSGLSQWWAGRHADRLGGEVAALAGPGDIRMLSSETCGFCTVARQWFTEQKVPFSECFIERDAACAAEFATHRAPGTPLLLVRGQAQLGFSPDRIKVRLQAPA
jgi:glutaredoxin